MVSEESKVNIILAGLVIVLIGLIWLTVHYAATIDGWHF